MITIEYGVNGWRSIPKCHFDILVDSGIPMSKKTHDCYKLWGDINDDKLDNLIGPPADQIFNKTEFGSLLKVCPRKFSRLIEGGIIPPGKFISETGKSFWTMTQVESVSRDFKKGRAKS